MIYVVEDDASIRELIIYTLRSTGFEAEGFDRGEPFWAAMERETPELVLLDIMLPGENGISILRKIREGAHRELPVILVTAKGAEYDKVLGLDSGADDYVTKPFGMMELVSRIKALLRRVRAGADQPLRAGEILLNPNRRQVTAKGETVALTYKEFELLQKLMEHHGRVLTRDALLSNIWGYDFDGETRTVDVHVRTLRQKLGECGDLIETIRGVGYRMRDGK